MAETRISCFWSQNIKAYKADFVLSESQTKTVAPAPAAMRHEHQQSLCLGPKNMSLSARPATVWRRRAILAGGALAVVAWTTGTPQLLSWRRTKLEYRDLPHLAPFRELVAAGTTSTGNPLFAGMSNTNATFPDIAVLRQQVRDNPCLALYGPSASSAVPVAFFSDFKCPNCRIMDAHLAEIEAKSPEAMRLVRHELPVLGNSSIVASRAVLAAQKQGAYRAMHAHLIRTPAIIDEDYLAYIAGEIGIDPVRMRTDMQSAAITAQLQRSRAIADVFQFAGTPAFAVGRTVFLGAIPKIAFTSLIAAERKGPCIDLLS